MAWNEPGGGNKDPWSGKGGDQGPPDLDEVVKKIQNGLGGLFGGKKKGGGNGSGEGPTPIGGGGGPGTGLIVGLVVVALIVILATDSFYTIQPGERGVVTRFGAYHTVTAPGLHLKLPVIDAYEKVNVDKVEQFEHETEMLTKDENIVAVALSVQYRIQNPADYKFQDSDPEHTIKRSMESALREVIGTSRIDDVMTNNRQGIAEDIHKEVQRLMDLYKTGLIVTSLNIRDASPPPQVREAFDDANRAREDKVRVVNEAQAYSNDVVPRARGEAARQLADAEAYKSRVVAEADGESKRFLALLREYEKSPKVTRERLYLETIQDVLAKTGKVILDVKGGNNLTYLPLDRIMRPAGASAAPSASSPVSAAPSAGGQPHRSDRRSPVAERPDYRQRRTR